MKLEKNNINNQHEKIKKKYKLKCHVTILL